MGIGRVFQRAYHLGERIVREGKVLPMRWRVFGPNVALETFRDGLIPPGKSARYIQTVEHAVDEVLVPLTTRYQTERDSSVPPVNG